MSKEDKHIDNLFKEKLEGRSFDGPPADFLADLNQRLDAKPAAPRGWIWILFLNLFIIGLFLANATIDFQATKTTQLDTSNEHKARHSVKENSLSNDKLKSKSNSTDTKSTNTEETNTKEVDRYSSEFNSDPLGTNQAKTDNNSSNDQANVSVGNKSTQKTDNNNTNREGSSDDESSELNNASTSANDTKSNVPNQSPQETTISGVGKEDQAKAKEKGVENGEKEQEKTNNEKIVSNKKGTLLNGTESLSSYVSYSAVYAPEFDEIDRKIKTNDFPAFVNPWDDLVTQENNDTSKETPKQKEDDKSMFEIQLQGGAARWGFNTLGTNENYVAELERSGTPKWTPSFGLAFHANLNKISIGTGIDYAKFKTENLFQFGEVTSYDSTYIAGYNQTYTYDSLGNIIDSTNTPYYDSTTITDTTYNTTTITNQYQWIQIPLHIGYRFNLNKWAVIPRVGMNIGLGIRQSTGQYPNAAYDDLQTLSPVKWHLNLHTSLEVRREFGRWHAFGKFNYQRNLTPTIDDALFERKFNGIGLNFGVGYSF